MAHAIGPNSRRRTFQRGGYGGYELANALNNGVRIKISAEPVPDLEFEPAGGGRPIARPAPAKLT